MPFQATPEELKDWQIALIKQGEADIANGSVLVVQKAKALYQRKQLLSKRPVAYFAGCGFWERT